MSLLNLSLNLLSYVDGPASNQPQVRLADIKYSMLGLPTDNFRNMPINLGPGESMVVASTARTISYTPFTVFAISASSGKMKIEGSFGQATKRDAGDNTTEWTLTRTGDIMKLTATGGAIPTLSTTVAGDIVTMSGAFNIYNQGDFTVLNRGASYVEFINPLGAPEVVTGEVLISSAGPVQKGDVIDITASEFAFSNRGTFVISRVTADFIEVLNPNVIAESVTGASSGISVYPYAYKWLMMATDRKVLVSLNGESTTSIEVEPHVEGDLARNPGLLLKRGKVFEVKVSNPGIQPVNGMLILSE
jgi:hypothetical protein